MYGSYGSFNSSQSGIAIVIVYVWYAVTIIQSFLGIGTAYRKTKYGGDNGVALWGWMIVFSIAAFIPGLGIYLWNKNK